MKIGDQLQRQRKLRNMSQNELADKLKISRQSISKWENGASLPSFSNVIAISELFDISLDELIKGDVELMNKFEDDKIGLSKIETIFTVGFVLVIASLIFIYSQGITVTSVDYWLPGLGIIFFLGFAVNIKWSVFNKSLNKKAVFFGILLLVVIVVPYIMHEVPDILEGIREGSNY
ncbi:helix-turn-helix domain-containing protein [Companilactobacillus muriivasis]|uniref:helix-turn-helix domain-containing protein n=1 Tax=Companilactobacillus muriivasis TaxID=3081444 RepID=UPI0030C7294D